MNVGSLQGAAVPSSLREANRRSILQLLRLEGSLSRAEIARRTGISAPTVSTAVKFFVAKGIAHETGEGEGRIGRKPILVEFNPDAAHTIGIDLGGNSIDVGVVNLAGAVKSWSAHPCPSEMISPDDLAVIPGLIEKALQTACLPREHILGVGIGVPGVTDYAAGTVRLAPRLEQEGLARELSSLKQILERQFGLPLMLENDVNAAALGEQRARGKDSLPNFVFVSVGGGIGAGLIVDGRLYRGYHNTAGEIGYMIVDGSYRQPRGDFGSLERSASCPALVARARALGWQTVTTGQPRLEEIVRQLGVDADAGAGPARQALEETAEHLGLALANTVAVYDPGLVVIGGPIIQAGDWFIRLLGERIDRISPLPVTLEVSRNGSLAGLVGAATVAFSAGLDKLLAN